MLRARPIAAMASTVSGMRRCGSKRWHRMRRSTRPARRQPVQGPGAQPHRRGLSRGYRGNNANAHLKRQIMGREVVVAVTSGRLDGSIEGFDRGLRPSSAEGSPKSLARGSGAFIDDQGFLVAIFSRRSPLVVVAGSGGPARGMRTAARPGRRLAATESSCASDSACSGHPPR